MSEREFQSMSNIPTSGPVIPSDEGRVLGKYRLTRMLGRGGMGEVWLARDTTAKIDVAVKFLPIELRRSEDAQEQLSESYRRVHGLHHPHICAVKDLILDPVVGYFLVMDYFEGLTLLKYRKEYLQKSAKKSFPVEELMRILMPVAEALDYAHGQGLLHRDIKPGNVLVSPDGSKVRVIDFQLATEIRATLSRYTNTKFDTSGTYPYMAPEQFRGAHATPATDQYALAMTAYELLAGQLPYETLGWDMWKGIVSDPQTTIPKIAGLSNPAMTALECGLALDPKKRAASCKSLLLMCFASEPVRTPVKEPVREPVRETVRAPEREKAPPVTSNNRTTGPQKSAVPERTPSSSMKSFLTDSRQIVSPSDPRTAAARSSVRKEPKPGEPARPNPTEQPSFLKSLGTLGIVCAVGFVILYNSSDFRQWLAKVTKTSPNSANRTIRANTPECEITYYELQQMPEVRTREVTKDGVTNVEAYTENVAVEVPRTTTAFLEPSVREFTEDGKVKYELSFADASIPKILSVRQPTWRWVNGSTPSVAPPTALAPNIQVQSAPYVESGSANQDLGGLGSFPPVESTGIPSAAPPVDGYGPDGLMPPSPAKGESHLPSAGLDSEAENSPLIAPPPVSE